MSHKVSMDLRGKTLSIETGEMAKQADGAVLVSYGETVVLVTAVASKDTRKDCDFLPLTVDYREKAYAAGKIPGGFFKREGRPGEKEVLTSRLMDRPIRPLFPEGYSHETQVISLVLSVDQENDPDILALIGASASLTISKIPFQGPIGAVRVGLIDDEFIINPTGEELEKSRINLIVAGTADAVVMVEGGGKEVPEEVFLDAIFYGHETIKEIVQLQNEMAEKIDIEKKMQVEVRQIDAEFKQKIEDEIVDKLKDSLVWPTKKEHYEKSDEIRDNLIDSYGEEDEEKIKDIKNIFEETEKKEIRNLIINKKIRPDGRGTKDIRSITSRIGVLPRTHGSALFTRGETQALVIATLGTSIDAQRLDNLEGKSSKSFMLHYNFPPFSVGEASFLRGPGRREIGHGALAERAISAVLPENDEFPYTIRLVSDVLESNGSSSMATVCGCSLSLMDAGIPIKSAVAGIAMGLIKDEEVAILSDISGTEDHIGDMDFKVAGTEDGITAIQMDIKIKGVSKEIMKTALEQAREGRLYILEKMKEVIQSPKEEMSHYAPKIVTLKIKTDKIRDLIGPGGKMIRSIIEKTGANIEVDDSGSVSISSPDSASLEDAIKMVEDITKEPVVGEIYMGKVKKIMDFGAFVEIFPGTEGLVHISQISEEHVKNVSDVLKEGDEFLVKVLEIDRQGKIRLSRKEALREQSSNEK